MPRHRLWLIACAACLLLGGWLGWRVRGEPPEPTVLIKYRDRGGDKSKEANKSTLAVASNTLEVTPPSHARKKITRYHPPPPAACAATDKPCVCPGPGPVAEVEETETITGKGTISTNTNANATDEKKKETHSTHDHQALQQEGYQELPRLSGAVGAAVSPFADDRRPAPALALTLRVYEHFTAQLVTESQLSDFEELRILAFVGFPITWSK